MTDDNFDASQTRNGMVQGEGAAVFMFEDYDHAALRAERDALKAARDCMGNLYAAADARALAAEAAALERAVEPIRKIVHDVMKALMLQGREGLLLADQLHKAYDKLRESITPAARTALDSAIADARREGKLEGLKEADTELTREFNITDIQVGYVVVTGASGTPARCRDVIRAIAARVEGGAA